DPPVLLLDEPSSSLDRQAEQELRQTITEIGRERTVIMVTHSPILLAACDDLVALDRGKVALAGPSKEILPKLFGQAPKPDAGAPAPQPSAPQPAAKQPPAPPAKAPAPAAKAPSPAAPVAPAAAHKRPAPAAARAVPKPAPAPGPQPAAQARAAAVAGPAPAATRPAPAPAPGGRNQPSTADPSVPAGEMFRLQGEKPSADDPYADLIDAARPKAPAAGPAGPAVVEQKR
ncbi:MAG: hypothetical protein ACE5GT_09540, partial [Rhodospirillales bacterium]